MATILFVLIEIFEMKDIYRQGNAEFHKDEVSLLCYFH